MGRPDPLPPHIPGDFPRGALASGRERPVDVWQSRIRPARLRVPQEEDGPHSPTVPAAMDRRQAGSGDRQGAGRIPRSDSYLFSWRLTRRSASEYRPGGHSGASTMLVPPPGLRLEAGQEVALRPVSNQEATARMGFVLPWSAGSIHPLPNPRRPPLARGSWFVAGRRDRGTRVESRWAQGHLRKRLRWT